MTTNKEKAIAQVFAASISALTEIEAMKIVNARTAGEGLITYSELDFRAIPQRFGISPEQVAQTFKEAEQG